MSELGGHPHDGDLLRYADGELSPAEARNVRAHLDSCWQCRAELSEIEQTIGQCVRYRNEDRASRLPDPPAPWMDVHARMKQLDEVLNGRPWYARAWEAASGALVRQRPLATAVAMMLIAALIVNQFRNAPAVRAAELLEKALLAQTARAADPKAAPRRIEVRTGSLRAVRTVGAAYAGNAVATLAAVEPLFAKARYDWTDPLNPASFARWRDSLAEKRDEVTTVRDAAAPDRKWYRVRTATDASYLEAATLQLTAEDLHPVEASFEFRNRERVDVSDLGPAETLATVPTHPAIPSPAESRSLPSPITAEPIIERPATAGEELEVLAALHRLGADLGEPVEVTRDGAQVVVKGFGVSPELGKRIAAELSAMPRAILRLEEPAAGIPTESPAVVRGPAPAANTAAWQGLIETHLGGRVEYDHFVDQMLAASDQLMVRMHALRRLAARFGPEVVTQLNARERSILQGLIQEHARTAIAQARLLDERCRPVLTAMGAKPRSADFHAAGDWQSTTGAMFTEARHAESLVAAMLGGVAAGGTLEAPAEELPVRLLSATAALRIRAAEFSRHTLP